MLPVQQFELVALTIAKDKQACGEGTEAEAFLHDRSQSVDRFAQVRCSAGEIDAMRVRECQHEALSAATASRRSLASKPACSAMRPNPT